MSWLQISTAPCDGSRVIVYAPIGGIMVALWAEKFSAHYGNVGPGWYSIELDCRVEPTHWQPLPLAPESLQAPELTAPMDTPQLAVHFAGEECSPTSA